MISNKRKKTYTAGEKEIIKYQRRRLAVVYEGGYVIFNNMQSKESFRRFWRDYKKVMKHKGSPVKRKNRRFKLW